MQLKRILAFLLILFSYFSFSLAFASSPATVLVSGDWAYNAIADLGLNRPIPDFDVPPEMTRNQSALMVSRLLEYLAGDDQAKSRRFGFSRDVYLENIIAEYNRKASQGLALTENQVEYLYRLALEFHSELEILGYAIQDFNLLLQPQWEVKRMGLFATEPLVYSQEAVAAVRKSVEKEEPAATAHFSTAETIKSTPEPAESRNLWTGSFNARMPSLPEGTRFLATEPEIEEERLLYVGNLELSGGIKPVESGTPPREDLPSTEGGAAYGISVKYGDLALKTAVDHLALDQSQDNKIISTSVDLSLDWLDLFTLNAGYKHIDGLESFSGEDTLLPTTTSLGVEVPITGGKVRLDVTQRWPRLNILEAAKGPSGELSPKNTAELGLSYEFENDSSLRFNYKFIDFSSVEHDYGATAEFSIKF